MGANRDKFIFIGGLSKLNDGDGDGCLADMKLLVEKFPQSKLAEMAGMIVNGVKEGRRLHGGKFDLGNVWSRRSVVLSDSDSIAARELSPERNEKFLYIVAYNPDSINENKLLFELARYNFTNYMVRNFNIEIVDTEGPTHMRVSGFLSYDEALQYARELHKQEHIMQLLKIPPAGETASEADSLAVSRILLISEPNLELLGKQFSYDDYAEFYEENFVPLEIDKRPLLSEPAEIGYEKEPVLNGRDTDEEGAEGEAVDDGEGGGNAEGGEFFGDDTGEPAEKTNPDDIIVSEDDDLGEPKEAQPTTPVTTGDDNNMVVTEDEPTTPVTTGDDNNIVVTEDEPVTPVTTGDDNNIVVTEEEPTTPVNTGDDNNIVVTEDEPTTPVTTGDDNIVVTEDEPTTPVTTDDDSIILEDDTTTTGTATDDEIILDDDEATTSTDDETDVIITDSDEKEDGTELEDEYFELDGF